MNSDKVKSFIIIEDILFSSSYVAADFILGYRVGDHVLGKQNRGSP